MEKMLGYIDFDGVILDTETGLFKQYHKLIDKGIEITRERYLAEMDWNAWIEQAIIINDIPIYNIFLAVLFM